MSYTFMDSYNKLDNINQKYKIKGVSSLKGKIYQVNISRTLILANSFMISSIISKESSVDFK